MSHKVMDNIQFGRKTHALCAAEKSSFYSLISLYLKKQFSIVFTLCTPFEYHFTTF